MSSQNNFDEDTHLSKALSWILRHGALKEGLNISSDGFISVGEILSHPTFRNKYTTQDIKRVVASNNKRRFHLLNVDGELKIRCNQGHSIQVPDLELQKLEYPSVLTTVIHATLYGSLEKIKQFGLCRMKRNHIHFHVGLPLNGSRRYDVLIYVDLNKALLDGLSFYRSKNGVILSPGNKFGYILPKYFLKICKIDGSLMN